MEQPVPRRGSGAAGFFLFLAIGGSAAGVIVYQHVQNNQKALITDATGFDIAQTPTGQQRPSSNAVAAAVPSQSSLEMVRLGMPGMQLGAAARTAPRAASTFTESCRASEAKLWALAERYYKRYPIIAQYDKEWMSHPDLRKLNDDYMRDHDPVRFLRGLVGSKSFGGMVKKYATNPVIQNFAKESIVQAPAGMMGAVADFLSEEKSVKSLAETVAQALGLPAGLLGGLVSSPKLDEKAVMDSMLKNNPALQKAMDDAGRK